MARIACFSDSAALVRQARLGLSGREHAIHPLPSSRLTDDLRRTVCQLAPDLILLELTHSLDNPHLFIFLKSDAATRDVPIILLSASQQLELYAAALGADGFVRSPFAPAELAAALAPFIGVPAHAPTLDLPRRRHPARTAPPHVTAPSARSADQRPAGVPALVPSLALA